ATDICAGALSVATSGTVSTNAVGNYTVSYVATDPSGNSATNTRVIHVTDTGAPVVTLSGNGSITIECHTAYNEPGATATDICAGTLSVATSGAVSTNAVGNYTVSYVATDPSGNSATNTRVIHVTDTTAPVVTLTGSASVTVECHSTFTDP